MKNTERFSDRVETYKKFRPSYPTEAIDYLINDFSITHGSVIADIGSGTGIFGKQLAHRGAQVIGIEPNGEMRKAALEAQGDDDRLTFLDGTAECTGLDDNSVDFIAVAQAFHWFNRDRAKREFQRILKPNGYVFLVWNRRLTDTDFLREYERILRTEIPEYSEVNHNNVTESIIREFIPIDFHVRRFGQCQEFHLDELLGRFQSSSYTPPEGTARYVELERLVIEAFKAHEINGLIHFNYQTEVFSGRFE